MLFKILLIIIMLGILVLSPAFFLFIIVGMAPALVSYFVDVRPNKNQSSSITFFNLAGLAIPASRFMRTGLPGKFADAMNASDLAIVYLFAAMGYFIVWLIPKITVIVIDLKNERRAITIREKISKLVEEWGPEVKKNSNS